MMNLQQWGKNGGKEWSLVLWCADFGVCLDTMHLHGLMECVDLLLQLARRLLSGFQQIPISRLVFGF